MVFDYIEIQTVFFLNTLSNDKITKTMYRMELNLKIQDFIEGIIET